MSIPIVVITGIARTVFLMLKCFEKKLKIKSIKSCVQKFINTKVPSKVNEIPYILWKVIKSMGGKLNTEDVDK
jgi:hypothetical protein